MSNSKYNYGDFLEDEGGHIGVITYVSEAYGMDQHYWITWLEYLKGSKIKFRPTMLFEREIEDNFKHGLFEYIGQHEKLFSMYLLLRENNEH